MIGELKATLPDGRSVKCWGCDVCGSVWLYDGRDCSKCRMNGPCPDCGGKREEEFYIRCAACRKADERKRWLALPEAPETDLLTWESDEYGDSDRLLEQICDAACDRADAADRLVVIDDFVEALLDLRPVNTEPQYANASRVYEMVCGDLLPEDVEELPPPLHAVVNACVEIIDAVAQTAVVSYCPGVTRPAGIVEKVREIAAEYVAKELALQISKGGE